MSHRARSIAQAALYSAAGGGLRQRQVHQFPRQRLDVEGVPAKQATGQYFVDMGLHGASAVGGLAEPNEAGIGLELNPKHIGELLQP
jgi:hypothetical protein